jgi:hypothetical protein
MKSVGNECLAIIHPKVGWCWKVPEQLLDGVKDIHILEASADADGQAKASVFIHDVE